MFQKKKPVRVLMVHGGAWEIPDEEIEAHIRGVQEALHHGWTLLTGGCRAVDVVEETVAVMEDDPTFDAGRGSILNTDGSIEMDASIMDGADLNAGAVAALRNFPNPVRVARRVMDKTEHILLAGEGCEAFARKQGFTPVSIENLLTPRELERLQSLIQDKKFRTPHAFGGKRGTVGAVALDNRGDLAAATSTGGTPRKIPGRVGDSPIIGCGTYAENGVGGISCTGWGESIMKVMLARTIADFLRSGTSPEAAVKKGIEVLRKRTDGLGGAICLDSRGRIGIAFNTPRMARGYMKEGLPEPVIQVLP
jgi:beta-aspartyl-peptidase (threonine type)